MFIALVFLTSRVLLQHSATDFSCCVAIGGLHQDIDDVRHCFDRAACALTLEGRKVEVQKIPKRLRAAQAPPRNQYAADRQVKARY